jgi:hypothetical protein
LTSALLNASVASLSASGVGLASGNVAVLEALRSGASHCSIRPGTLGIHGAGIRSHLGGAHESSAVVDSRDGLAEGSVEGAETVDSGGSDVIHFSANNSHGHGEVGEGVPSAV